MSNMSIRDKEIVTKSFRLLTKGMPTGTVLDSLDWSRKFNVFSSATGDNRYINPVPQSSPATDPRYGRILKSNEGGMGSTYKEIYDENAAILTITPGVPEFAGLLSFITNMFNPTAAMIANKGRAPGFLYNTAQAAGSILFWPMQLLSVSTQFVDFLANNPKNNFYSVKPTMGAYIIAANGVLNDIMVRLGYVDPLLPNITQEDHSGIHGKDLLKEPPKDQITFLQTLLPGVINKDGTIDVMRLVMGGVRKHRAMINKLVEMDSDGGISDANDKLEEAKKLIEGMEFSKDVLMGRETQNYVDAEMKTVGRVRGPDEAISPERDSAWLNKDARDNIHSSRPEGDGVLSVGTATANIEGEDGSTAQLNFSDYTSSITKEQEIARLMSTETFGLNTGEEPVDITASQDAMTDRLSSYYEETKDSNSWLGNVKELLSDAAYGGLDGLSFRIEGGTGPTSDSFSNSMTQSPMAAKFNSVVKEANNFKFDIADGATGIGIIDGIVNSLREVGTGFLSGTVIGNIPLALAGNTYIKVPDHWDGSTTSLHKESYSLQFECNYAHPYEQIMKIWIPFSLLLPLVAPMTAGGSSHTSPFYCKAFSQSRSVIRTGMVESMNFTFGSGDAGWTKDRKPLNLKVDLTIVDLEPIISVPIDRSTVLSDLTNPSKIASRVFGDDTAYNNYINRITGVSFLETVMKYQRLNRNLTGLGKDLKLALSSQAMAAKLMDSPVGDIASIFTRSIHR